MKLALAIALLAAVLVAAVQTDPTQDGGVFVKEFDRFTKNLDKVTPYPDNAKRVYETDADGNKHLLPYVEPKKCGRVCSRIRNTCPDADRNSMRDKCGCRKTAEWTPEPFVPDAPDATPTPPPPRDDPIAEATPLPTPTPAIELPPDERKEIVEEVKKEVRERQCAATSCSDCRVVVDELMNHLKNIQDKEGVDEQQIKHAISGVCTLAKVNKAKCHKIIDEHGDDLAAAILSGDTPDSMYEEICDCPPEPSCVGEHDPKEPVVLDVPNPECQKKQKVQVEVKVKVRKQTCPDPECACSCDSEEGCDADDDDDEEEECDAAGHTKDEEKKEESCDANPDQEECKAKRAQQDRQVQDLVGKIIGKDLGEGIVSKLMKSH